MEYLTELFGDITLSVIIVLIGAIIFLVKCYKRVEKYFSEKAIADNEKNEEFKAVIDQTKLYPAWHQHSLDVQTEYNRTFKDISEKMDSINNNLKELKEEMSEGNATSCRYRILRFNDEILHQSRHSEEHFGQILSDIDTYETYCKTHPNYKNSKAVCAIKNIKETHEKCMKEHSFL